MLTMDQIHRIREMYYEQDQSLTDIASELHLNWKTVKKYVDKEDFNVPVHTTKETHSSKLDPYKPMIDAWLLADTKAPRKQRHTARRVYARLRKEEGCDCSYRLVANYMAAMKKELHMKKQRSYLSLTHYPGEAQADFGTTDFEENGHYYPERKYLVLSFPYSNGGYFQLNYGENLEALLEGAKAMFEYMGGVPTEIWFDNTQTIVTKIIKGGGRTMTDQFRRIAEHYRFKLVFMNPESGWEKGNVEKKVGYLRDNELVPVPSFPNLAKKNEELLQACDADMEREHYDKHSMISELFQEDRAALIPLPSIPFDTACYMTVHTNKYGKFTLDEGRHRYSTSSDFCDADVYLKITSAEVIVCDAHQREIVRHRRLYGKETAESMQWVPYLKDIARKPRSLFHTGIYELMPPTMQAFMHECANSERGRMLKVLAELTTRTGFESAVQTVNEAIQYHARDPESLKSLYRRTFADVPVLPPLSTEANIPAARVLSANTDLKALDNLLQRRHR